MEALILMRDWMSSQVEFWMPTVGYDGYDVSSFGNVRSYRGTKNIGGRYGAVPIRLSEPRPKKTIVRTKKVGYVAVSLMGPEGEELVDVHRLVANAFLSNPENKPQVNHRNAIKGDNRLDNLERSTHAENHLHATLNGLRPRGTEQWKARIDDDIVRKIRQLSKEGMLGKDIAKLFQCGTYTVSGVLRGRIWKHVT